MSKWLKFVSNSAANRPEITIYDRIGKSPWDNSGIADKEFAELLNGIPKGTKFDLRLNSGGGSVKDGLAMYNRLMDRRQDVTCYIDGWACSAASWLACACGKVVIPENAMMMIHDPRALIIDEMTAPELREAADWLDKNKQILINMYQSKTGRSEKEISDAMTAETWFTGKEAMDWGLADSVSKPVEITNTFDLSRFRRVPTVKQNNSAPENGGAKTENTLKMREKIIALLNAHKIAFPADATDEQLAELLNKIQPQSATPPAPAAPPAPAPAPTNVVSVDDLVKKFAAVEKQLENERKSRIETAIDTAISESRIPANSREAWLKRAVADETVLTDLATLPPRLPGSEPVAMSIEITSASPGDISKAMNRMKESVNSWRKGNNVSAKVIGADAMNFAAFFEKNRDRVLEVANSNTISADLERTVILQDVIRAFRKNLIALRAFSFVFNNVPLQASGVGASAKISVPFYPLVSTASTDWNGSNGYVMGDSTINDADVTINKRKYQPIRFGSDELNRSPFVSTQRLVGLKIEKLAYDVFTDVASVVTVANYGASVFAAPAASFDSDDLADLFGVGNTNNWPKSGRSLVVHTDFDTALRKDPAIKNANTFGGTEAIRGGDITGVMVGGFEYYESVNVPTNSEALAGFICLPQAALVATSPILPDESIRRVLQRYDVVTDVQTGLSFEYRLWGNPDFDQRREVVECNYGYNIADSAALKRITTS